MEKKGKVLLLLLLKTDIENKKLPDVRRTLCHCAKTNEEKGRKRGSSPTLLRGLRRSVDSGCGDSDAAK